MRKNCPLITAVTGFIILVIGIICAWYAFPKLIENAIQENIALKEGTVTWSTWKKQPFPLKFKIYFFNVQNPEEVSQGANPILRETGPYVYDEYREKVNITINDERDTIRYVLKKTFFFNQKESGCRSDEDYVTIINAGLVGIALQVELLMPSVMSMIDEAIPYLYPGTKDVFLRAKVKDVLFNGLPIYCKDPEVDFVCGAMQGALPPTLKVVDDGKKFMFSMFNYMNGTDDGPYEIGRGIKNTTKGHILAYKDQPLLSQWGGPTCNTIKGTDSTIFPPFRGPVAKLYTFAQDFCRSLYASYVEDTVHLGIPVRKYMSAPESIQNNDENICFCPQGKDAKGNDKFKCPINGLLDVTPCLKAPIYISYPHFLYADRILLKYVTGLEPKEDIHASYAYLEPKTGTPVSGMKRVQLNIELKKFTEFHLLNNVSEGIFPVLWVEEGSTLTDEYLNILRESFSKMDLVNVFKWLLILSGLLTMIASFVMVMYREKLLCFTKVGNAEITIPKRNDQVHHIENLSEIQYNNTVIYPTLYPQVDNKNTNDGMSRRQQFNQAQAHGAWNIKI